MNYIKDMTKRVLLILLMVATFINSHAQNCFENLGEVSGINISQYAGELNTAACQLVETLPVEFQPQFKVFDFGFYSLEGSMDSDINELWSEVIVKAQSKSPYYLLIGKISGASGIYSDFLVDLKLPPIFDPECADIVTRKVAEIRNILTSESTPQDFVQKEKDAMLTLHNVGTCEICDDGIDNDGDDLIDCDDFDCLYLQISSQLKDEKTGSTSRNTCTPLTPEQLDIFMEHEDYIVSWGYESSPEVLLEIEAISFAKCFVGAMISAFADYTLYWVELNLTNDKYYEYFSTTTAKNIFAAHGYSIAFNAGSSCVESCIPFVGNRIKKLIKDLGHGFATGFIEAAEAEYTIHANNWCTFEEIIVDEMDWAKIFRKAGTTAVISVITGELGSQLSPVITNAFNTNKGKVIDRIKSGIGHDVWLAIKNWLNLGGTNILESVLSQLKIHFTNNGNLSKWDDFIGDFGNVLSDLQWFITNTSNKVKAWEEALTRNLPASWRTNPGFLKPFAKALDEKPKIDLHLTGHVNSNGNAVGCHLSSAIDNVNVRLRNPQPSGLPTYYPDGTFKKAAVDINDGGGNWIPKNANSTFFPDGWTSDKMLEEIAYIRSQTANQINDRKWRGLASDGVTEIEVRYTGPLDNLTFDTAFPIL